MMRFIHIGDFHAQAGPRNDDKYTALDTIIVAGEQMDDLGAWLWPGDLDHARMGIDDKNGLSLRVQRMAETAPVVICYGNHDLPGDLDFLSRLSAKWPIYVIDTPQVVRVHGARGPVSIFVLAYPTRAGLVMEGVAPSAVIDAANVALDAMFIDAAGQLQDARSRGALTMMIGHVNVAGAMTSIGQPNIGKEIEVSADQLARFGPIYIGLNHIHKHQQIGGAVYPGSICRLDWGEIEPKGYVVISYDAHVFSEHWGPLPRWNFIPLDVPPMYHVEGELTRDGFTWQCTAGPNGDIQPPPTCACVQVDGFGGKAGCLSCCGSGVCWTGCEVRVRYRFKQSERSGLRDAAVCAQFAGALKLEIEPIAVPDRALRSPDVAAARTLDEKFLAWCKVNGISVIDGTLDKLGRLQHGDHLQVLDELQKALANIEAPVAQKATTVAA